MAGEGLSPGAAWPRGVALAAAVLLAVQAAWSLDLFRRAERPLVDLRFALRGPRPPHPEIILVGLDEESAARYGRRTGAWTRAEFAAAVRNLTRAGAAIIVFDVIFSRPDPDPEQDAALARALFESGRVVLATDVSERNTAYPIAALREQEVGEGFVNLVRDPDGVLRRIPPPRLALDEAAGEGDGGASLILPLAAEVAVLHAHPDAAPEAEAGDGRFRIGEVSVPVSEGGMPINFAGGAGTFPAMPFWRALEGAIPEGSVEGKIVLVGSMHPLQHDHFAVPFHASRTTERSVFRERREVALGDMYGVEVQAHALDTLLSGRALVAARRGTQAWIWAAAGSISAVLLVILRLGPWVSAALLAGGLIAHAAAAQWLFAARGIVVDLIPGGLILAGHFVAGILLHRALDLRKRREVQRLFGRYVSPRVAEALLEDPGLVRLGGRKALLTVFFSDIRGFTGMSESLPPEEVAALLQEYFTEMAAVVFRHGGTLDKFIGDAIMVFFGDPVPQPDHAERALRMALEMRESMERLKRRWRSMGRHTFDPGIGINTGEVIVGNTGSADRFSYTVLGDNVNLAQRLEASAGPGQILVSAATHAAIADADEKFVFNRLSPMKVKGKAEPVVVYEVLYARDARSEQRPPGRAPILCGILLGLVALLAGCGAPAEPPPRDSTSLDGPVLLFGVDGLEWDLLLPMIREGDLPVLERLMRAGTYGLLETMRPTVSPAIWTSVATGKAPAKHGILHFLAADARGGKPRLFTGRDRKTKAIWDIYSDHDRTVHSLGWWMTFPAEPVNGTMVAQTNTDSQIDKAAGRAIWKGGVLRGLEGQVHPPEFQEKVMDVAEEVETTLPDLAREVFGPFPHPHSELSGRLWKNTLWALRADTIYRRVASEILSRAEPFDLMLVYFGGPDVVSHRFWRYMFPEQFRHPPTPEEIENFSGMIRAYYRYVDASIGSLVDAVEGEATVLVLSDHGMHPVNREKLFDPDEPPDDVNSGGHRLAPPGVLIAAGRRIRRMPQPSPPAVPAREDLAVLGTPLDIAPTLLFLEGLPIGSDMDGVILERILEPGFLAAHRPSFVPTHDTRAWLEERPDRLLPLETERERLEQLRALGYIE